MPRHHVTFNASSPSVIVPLTGKDDTELDHQIEALAGLSIDIVEWRLDLHKSVVRSLPDPRAAVAALERLRLRLDTVTDGVPLLVTARTTAEGGEAECAGADYARLVGALTESGFADLVDVEYRHAAAAEAMRLARASGTTVVASNHDFDATPGVDEIVQRLADMEAMGADVAKLAAMPRSREDVAALLQATARRFAGAHRPIITISMGALGVPSRLVGGAFGSAATFAAVGPSSAPGQVPLDDVRAVLDVL